MQSVALIVKSYLYKGLYEKEEMPDTVPGAAEYKQFMKDTGVYGWGSGYVVIPPEHPSYSFELLSGIEGYIEHTLSVYRLSYSELLTEKDIEFYNTSPDVEILTEKPSKFQEGWKVIGFDSVSDIRGLFKNIPYLGEELEKYKELMRFFYPKTREEIVRKTLMLKDALDFEVKMS